MRDWLLYSGIDVIITVNPAQWRWSPWASTAQDEWSGPNRRTLNIGWLFLTIKIWKDNGVW